MTNVGFAQSATPRDLCTYKAYDAFLNLEVEALLPNQTSTVTKTARLGLDPLTRRTGWTLTPLYDAGKVLGALRYRVREENLGNDGWGTHDAYNLLNTDGSLVFDDLSLEHGGHWEGHDAHQTGTSIDTRHFGQGGDQNPLNGSDPTARKAKWDAAEAGDTAALREMVAWIRANRTQMDALFRGSHMSSILVGKRLWNLNPIMNGTFGDGTAVVDPDTNQPLGAWQPVGKIKPFNRHLDHVHLEQKPRSTGNTP